MTEEPVTLHDALNAMTEQIAIVSGGGVVVLANTAWRQALAVARPEPREPVGLPLAVVLRSAHGVSESAAARMVEGIDRVLGGRVREFTLEHLAGAHAQPRWYCLRATPLAEGRQGALITRRDITAQKTREADLLERAHRDALTGLSNRAFFLLEAGRMLALAKRHAWRPALLYLDIDNFKDINDQHGHAVGDEVLRRVGDRLRRLTRESDVLARLGGDEFVVLVNDVTVEHGTRIVQGYRRSLAQPPIIDGQPILIQASFGVARYPADGVTVEALVSVADGAMYAAKRSRAQRRRHAGTEAAHARAEPAASR